MMLMSAFNWHINKETVKASAAAMQANIQQYNYHDYIEIDKNNNIVFLEDKDGKQLKDVVLQNIEDAGIDSDEMGLNSDNLMQEMINAEIVTNYPYLGGDGLQGIVNFYRREYDADEEDEGK